MSYVNLCHLSESQLAHLAPCIQLNAVLCDHARENEPPSRSGLFCGQKISNGKYECLGCETKLLLENKTLLKLNIIMQSHLTLTSQNDPTHQSNLLIDQTRDCPCNLSGCRPPAPRNQSHTRTHRIGELLLQITKSGRLIIIGNHYSPTRKTAIRWVVDLPTRNLSDEMVPWLKTGTSTRQVHPCAWHKLDINWHELKPKMSCTMYTVKYY